MLGTEMNFLFNYLGGQGEGEVLTAQGCILRKLLIWRGGRQNKMQPDSVMSIVTGINILPTILTQG